METECRNSEFEAPDWSTRIATVTAEADSERGATHLGRSIGGLLRLVREQLDLEVVFVGEFVEGRRVFRHVSATPASSAIVEVGQSHALDATVCNRIVEGSMPNVLPSVARVRTEFGLPPVYDMFGGYIGVPVRFLDGSLYGVLCGFSFTAREQLNERDVRRLEMAANAAARLLAQAQGLDIAPTV